MRSSEEEYKQNFINNLTISLADVKNGTVKDLKEAIEKEFQNINLIKTVPIEIPTENPSEWLLDKFVQAKRSTGMAKGTIVQYQTVYNQILSFTEKELNTITSDDIIDFLNYQRDEKHLASSTINNKYRLLTSIYNFLYDKKYLTYNPMADVEAPRRNVPIKVPLSSAEIEHLKIAIDDFKSPHKERVAAELYLLLNCGMRISELTNIKFKDIDFNKKQIIIRKGKGDKDRVINYNDSTDVRLQEYLEIRNKKTPNDYLIASINAEESMTTNAIRKDLNRLGRVSGVTRIHPHLLRATFATHLFDKGTSIHVIANLLGHNDLGTINRYVIVSNEQKRIAINTLD